MSKKSLFAAGSADGPKAARRILMTGVNTLAPDVGMVRACSALRVHRSGVYREDVRRRYLVAPAVIRQPRPAPPLALSEPERQVLQEVLCGERFADCAPPTIYATLLDEGTYLASVRTMYRLLAANDQARERRHQLTLHADRGTSMRSKTVAELLVDLEVTKSHSRPYVSDDNPYSEAHFKTLKYRPEFPARFGCLEDARAHCQGFFPWYNDTHRHSGIGYTTPAAVHYGRAQGLFRLRADTLDAAFMVNSKRFK
jgi:transposase InsO family protein